jgi:flavodoxin I
MALVYHSSGGNTKALAEIITALLGKGVEVFQMKDFDILELENYDGLVVGSYTWGDGDLPARAKMFYQSLEQMDVSHLTTAIFWNW